VEAIAVCGFSDEVVALRERLRFLEDTVHRPSDITGI
jgi:hypothetical protein